MATIYKPRYSMEFANFRPDHQEYCTWETKYFGKTKKYYWWWIDTFENRIVTGEELRFKTAPFLRCKNITDLRAQMKLKLDQLNAEDNSYLDDVENL